MRFVTFYDESTGLLNGVNLLVSDDAAVVLNTPVGHKAVDHPRDRPLDHLSQRIDLMTGKIIDFTPEAPRPGIEWDKAHRRWQSTETAKRLAKNVAAVRQKIAALESEQTDLLRSLVLSLTQTSMVQEAIRLREMDADITALRAQL